MYKHLLRRNYTTGWYSLSRVDAINGLISHLAERQGVKDINIESCIPAQLSGDKGYEIQVTYHENLDETFGFSDNINKVIFLDRDSTILPYFVENIARETGAGIVITTLSVKDEFYDVGNLFPTRLVELMENAEKMGVQIVGITPSISGMNSDGMPSSEKMAYSISSYLEGHPNIKRYVIVNKTDLEELSPNVFVGDDI